jgi:dihydrofolate reductase
MRRIINSTFITIDGAIQNPQNWPSSSDVEDPAGEEMETELLLGSDAVLMGRHTYDVFAAVWPTRSGDPYSDKINTMPKYVVSSTLKDPEWANTTVIADDVAGRIARLKEQDGGDLVQYGFGQLSFTLLENGLLDELRLWVYPLIVGSGGPGDLLYRDTTLSQFELTDTRPLKTGVVRLTYRAKR